MKLALLTLMAPVAVAVTFVRLSALVPPVTFTWSIVTGCAKETPDAAMAGMALGVKFTALTVLLSASVTVPVSVGRVPAAIVRLFRRERRALPVQRLVGIQRQVPCRRGAAGVHVDDVRRA